VKPKAAPKKEIKTCPVPPWEAKRIMDLAEFLCLSQARLAQLMGVSYSTLRSLAKGRIKALRPATVAQLKRFEKTIPTLRRKAQSKLALKAEVEIRRQNRLEKPWPVSRIRAFMHTWGMSQAEFALFCGVSYDSVTSWSRGRRRLVRRHLADHIERAETLARTRGFRKARGDKKSDPWVSIRAYLNKQVPQRVATELPSVLKGAFPIAAVEEEPGKYRLGRAGESLSITPGKKKGTLVVTLPLGKKSLSVAGTWFKMGGAPIMALTADPKDPEFFDGKAGCLSPSQKALRISLWSARKLPLRLWAELTGKKTPANPAAGKKTPGKGVASKKATPRKALKKAAVVRQPVRAKTSAKKAAAVKGKAPVKKMVVKPRTVAKPKKGSRAKR
jgi:DNA-binding transcriptional regulator YiaG